MRTDGTLREDVMSALISGLRFNEQEVAVSVARGRVFLRGRVHSQAEKIAITRAVRRVEGVLGVVDELVVTYGHGTAPTDSEIAKSVQRALDTTLAVPPGSVRIKVEGGQVILEGHVTSLHQRETIHEVIRHLAGVRRVIDHLVAVPDHIAAARTRGLSLDAGIPWGWRAELRDRVEHHEHGIPVAHHHTDPD
jgi:osmotically-inducible protein OsmY